MIIVTGELPRAALDGQKHLPGEVHFQLQCWRPAGRGFDIPVLVLVTVGEVTPVEPFAVDRGEHGNIRGVQKP